MDSIKILESNDDDSALGESKALEKTLVMDDSSEKGTRNNDLDVFKADVSQDKIEYMLKSENSLEKYLADDTPIV